MIDTVNEQITSRTCANLHSSLCTQIKSQVPPNSPRGGKAAVKSNGEGVAKLTMNVPSLLPSPSSKGILVCLRTSSVDCTSIEDGLANEATRGDAKENEEGGDHCGLVQELWFEDLVLDAKASRSKPAIRKR